MEMMLGVIPYSNSSGDCVCLCMVHIFGRHIYLDIDNVLHYLNQSSGDDDASDDRMKRL
jgi:hypothetical protein